MAHSVLVVDDDPLVLEVTAALLEDFGCKVLTEATAASAIAHLARNDRIEILITDINMPVMNGYELAERARHMREALHVILLTGQESDGHGFPLIRKSFLGADLRRAMIYTSGLC
jgi:CheY-like chemotaxis protein